MMHLTTIIKKKKETKRKKKLLRNPAFFINKALGVSWMLCCVYTKEMYWFHYSWSAMISGCLKLLQRNSIFYRRLPRNLLLISAAFIVPSSQSTFRGSRSTVSSSNERPLGHTKLVWQNRSSSRLQATTGRLPQWDTRCETESQQGKKAGRRVVSMQCIQRVSVFHSQKCNSRRVLQYGWYNCDYCHCGYNYGKKDNGHIAKNAVLTKLWSAIYKVSTGSRLDTSNSLIELTHPSEMSSFRDTQFSSPHQYFSSRKW